MKKLSKILLFTLVLTLAVLCMSACDLPDGLIPNDDRTTTTPTSTTTSGVHTHTYEGWEANETQHRRVCTLCGEPTAPTDHAPVTDPAKEATCGRGGLTAGSHCSVCSYVIVAQTATEPTGQHAPVTVPGTPATCGEVGLSDGSDCSVCGMVLTAQTELPPTGEHNSIPCGIVEPTFDSEGCASGMQCTVCHHLTEGDSVIPAFRAGCGDYGYTSLASLPDGTELQQLYSALFEACADFHNSTADAELSDGKYIAVTLDCEKYGLSADQVFSVLKYLIADCPVFYWTDGRATASSVGDVAVELLLLTDSVYAVGANRSAINEEIYSAMVSMYVSGCSDYETVYRLHDIIIDGMYYAYDSSGTPSNEAWAHNIVGYFVYGAGVCESYAEVCQLMLNYHGVENILASGNAGGEAHAWNLVQIDGGWYWLDLTWDDQPAFETGRIYDYFCRTDSGFELNERTLDTDLYALPDRATQNCAGDLLAPGSTFSVGKFTYAVVGYGQAELNTCTLTGAVTVPETVAYGGRCYEVVGIGFLEDGYLSQVFSEGVTSLHIPATVRYIRGAALYVGSLNTVTIDSESKYLFSYRGGIYTRDGRLVYLLYSADSASLALEEGATGICSFAILYPSKLAELSLPSTFREIEQQAFVGCDPLAVTFAGTRAEWSEVVGTEHLPDGSTVTCSDGSIGG